MKLLFLFLTIIAVMSEFAFSQDAMPESKISHRPPMVAGAFYPSNPDSLKSMIGGLLDTAKPAKLAGRKIIGLVAPHAGYAYSGFTAGKVYKELIGRKYDAIIIVAPSHQESFQGASVFSGDAYVTPLGVVEVDKVLAKSISSHNDLLKYSLAGHGWTNGKSEHSIEVQLPFLQTVLPGTPIVPIIMGSQDFHAQDKLMQAIVNAVNESKKEILLVASSDLSHFHSYDTARSIDIPAVKTFGRYDYFAFQSLHISGRIEACGGGPIATVMMAAEALGANIASPISYKNSGDSEAGKSNRDRVVGYFSGVLVADDDTEFEAPDFNDDNKKFLLDLAKKIVRQTVTNTQDSLDNVLLPMQLNLYLPAFVTVKKDGNLRACMGHTFATENVGSEVVNASRLACTSDYRFGPIKEDELNKLDYEITVMTRMKRILDFNKIEIGKDGLYFRLGKKSGLLLPQVASERNWSVVTFLENLSEKAGLNKDAYLNPDAQIFVFRALIIKN
jgi:AmmeMemoRadiSam system protein B/AmmeMemoRadiSam system protein A